MVSLLLSFRHGHGDVARSFQNLIHASPRTWSPTLQRSPGIGKGPRHHELLWIHIEIVLRVCRGRAQHLGDRTRPFLRQVPKNRDCLIERLSANRLEDQAHLLRRDANITRHGAYFDTSHDLLPASPSAHWTSRRGQCGHGTFALARTLQACGPPCSLTRRSERVADHHAQRWCVRPSLEKS